VPIIVMTMASAPPLGLRIEPEPRHPRDRVPPAGRAASGQPAVDQALRIVGDEGGRVVPGVVGHDPYRRLPVEPAQTRIHVLGDDEVASNPSTDDFRRGFASFVRRRYGECRSELPRRLRIGLQGHADRDAAHVEQPRIREGTPAQTPQCARACGTKGAHSRGGADQGPAGLGAARRRIDDRMP